MRTSESWYRTRLEIQQIRSTLNSVLRRAEVKPLQHAALDDPADFAIYIEQGRGWRGGRMGAQVLVYDDGEQRRVQFVALGEGALSQMAAGMNGVAETRTVVHLKLSRKFVAELATALQSADPQLQQIG